MLTEVLALHFLKYFSIFAMSACLEEDDQEVYDDIAAGQGIYDMD